MCGSSWTVWVGVLLVLAGPAMAGEPDSLVRAYQLEKEALQQDWSRTGCSIWRPPVREPAPATSCWR